MTTEEKVKAYEELKESGDERIKKAIIRILKGKVGYTSGEDIDRYVAWLEKQKSVRETVERCKNSWYNEGKIAGMTEGLTNDEKYQQGWHDALENQGKQKPPVIDFKANNWYVSKVDGKIHDITYNSTDKVEPKFKFGDWIVNNNSKDVFLIKSTNSGYCTLESIKGNIISPCLPPCESESHIWTIQDAKDGDVLHSPTHHLIWIYKDDKHYYVCINLNYTSNNISVDGSISIPNDVCPATKEQRDTLEKAMADAGYTFNFDKKSLKKIYQKPAWSDEDEKMLDFCIKHYADGNCITWLESLKERMGGK